MIDESIDLTREIAATGGALRVVKYGHARVDVSAHVLWHRVRD